MGWSKGRYAASQVDFRIRQFPAVIPDSPLAVSKKAESVFQATSLANRRCIPQDCIGLALSRRPRSLVRNVPRDGLALSECSRTPGNELGQARLGKVDDTLVVKQLGGIKSVSTIWGRGPYSVNALNTVLERAGRNPFTVDSLHFPKVGWSPRGLPGISLQRSKPRGMHNFGSVQKLGNAKR